MGYLKTHALHYKIQQRVLGLIISQFWFLLDVHENGKADCFMKTIMFGDFQVFLYSSDTRDGKVRRV